MGLSRHEINLRRLLAKCELLHKNHTENENFEKYIDTLENMVQEVKKYPDASIQSLREYQKRILNLKTSLGITTTSKYEEFNDPLAMRENLLGVRQRHINNDTDTTSDLDQVIKYHEEVQEKITDDMLAFTKSLKEQSELANRIIKKDTEIVTNSTNLTEQNVEKLLKESSKLNEYTKAACKCWLWFMLAFVLVVFVYMVVFMKVMKKSK